jgi:hypothetical protein
VDSGCLNAARHRERNGKQPPLIGGLPVVRIPVVAAIGRPLIIEEDIAKHVLQTDVEIVFL